MGVLWGSVFTACVLAEFAAATLRLTAVDEHEAPATNIVLKLSAIKVA